MTALTVVKLTTITVPGPTHARSQCVGQARAESRRGETPRRAPPLTLRARDHARYNFSSITQAAVAAPITIEPAEREIFEKRGRDKRQFEPRNFE